MKRKMIFVIIAVFVLLSAPSVFAAYEFYLGAITKIEGRNITLRNGVGQIRAFQ